MKVLKEIIVSKEIMKTFDQFMIYLQVVARSNTFIVDVL